ncbi:hypothetical protein GCM10007079_04740 [Nocardiopsis terrae]|nr:hypothetical protein GCM10007079_04740 [Nocardiopsis terrae]
MAENWTELPLYTNMGAAPRAPSAHIDKYGRGAARAKRCAGKTGRRPYDPYPGAHHMTRNHTPLPTALRRSRFGERHRLPAGNRRPLGTNGYTNAWGTNAHGELSSCPPGPG